MNFSEFTAGSDRSDASDASDASEASGARLSRAARRVLSVPSGFALAMLIGSVLAGPAQAADPFLRRTATVDVVERIGPSVVNITTERLASDESPFHPRGSNGAPPRFEEFFQNFYEPRQRTVQSLGSGVIFDREGHILTNMHVVARATRVRVALADQREFDAEVIGADERNDLAVLRIKMERRETLPYTKPGDSADLMVGEPVIAIGNPFGFSNSVTTGVISAQNRSVNGAGGLPFHGLLQTDALINPGNSGGPLLNAEGRLIGINVAIWGGAQGIGFAIPIDTAKRVIRELLLYGEVQPVWLGLEFQEIEPALRQVLDLPTPNGGVLIGRVQPGSPAARAGVRRGDVIVGINGRRAPTAVALNEEFKSMIDGQPVDFELFRDGEVREVRALAEEMPRTVVANIAHRLLGLQLEQSVPENAFVIRQVREGSGAEALGLRSGDFLLRMNGVVLHDDEALRRAIAKLRGNTRALVVVQRGPGRYHLTIPLR